MRLAKIVKTSSFRLTLLYAAIFCLSFLAIFAAIYWSTAVYMDRQIDDTVSSEVAEIRADAAGLDRPHVTAIVDSLATRSPGFFYLLQDERGARLAGNLAPMTPVVGLHEEPRQLTSERDHGRIVRGEGARLEDGSYLFVGLSTFQLREMQEMIRRVFEWGLAATIVIAFLGGFLTSLGVLGRIEALSRVSREIVAGDLKRRIELSGSGDEFDHLATSLNAMLDRIETLMEGVRQMSTDIAHDLRTPLTRLRQRVERATRKATDVGALRAALELALRDVDAVLETFAALLRIAQVEATARRAGFTSVDLTEVLHTVVEVYLPMVEEKRQTVVDSISPGLHVEGDRELLMQLFANLVENAVRHTPQGARIEVAAAKTSPDAIEIIITDDGPGIPDAMRGKVFQRFFRLDASRSTSGNGLGLSLAAAVAALHGSTLELSDHRPGLCVRLVLPAGRAATDGN